MEPTPFIIESKVTHALIEEYVNENPFVKLIDTLLLTVKNVTFGIGKISKTLSDTDILEFIIEMPVINTNVIIQYDLKIREQSPKNNFYLGNIPETILDIKKESDEYTNENRGDVQVTPYESSRAIINISNNNYEDMIISCKENIHGEDREITISNVANDVNEDSIYSGLNMKNSCSDYIAANGKTSVSKKRYHCSVCGKSFSALCHKNVHERFHSGERPYSCEMCSKSFFTASDKKRHEKIHTPEIPISNVASDINEDSDMKNSSCSDYVATNGNTSVSKKKYHCSVCGKSFSALCHKIVHERFHSGERPYSCEMCSKSFFTASDKKRHEKIHTAEMPISNVASDINENSIYSDPDMKNSSCSDYVATNGNTSGSKKRYHCRVCGKSFSALCRKNVHERFHSGERSFSCHVCGKSFFTASDKKRHERIHTAHIPISNVASDINEDSIYSGSNMKNSSSSDYVGANRNTSVSKKRYHCSICGKSFSALCHKNVHERFHSGERPYSCEVCSKSFFTASDKKRHERIHTGERPYSCSVCGKSFSTSYNKIAHERIHTGERPYPCTICGKSFMTTKEKKRHETTHIVKKTSGIFGKRYSNPLQKTIHELIHTGKSSNSSVKLKKEMAHAAEKSSSKNIKILVIKVSKGRKNL